MQEEGKIQHKREKEKKGMECGSQKRRPSAILEPTRHPDFFSRGSARIRQI